MVNRSQSLSRSFSIIELVQARTVGLYKAYGGRLLKLNKRDILGYKSQHSSSSLASSIFS